jgi:hypothetical protein
VQPARINIPFQNPFLWPVHVGLAVISAFRHASRLSYWHRVWVVQEVMSARKALVLYGDHSLQYSKFLEFWELMRVCVVGLVHNGIPDGQGHRGLSVDRKPQ